MNPYTLHHSKLIPEIFSRLGTPEKIESKLTQWYELRDQESDDKAENRVRALKEYKRNLIYSHILDNNKDAIELYNLLEASSYVPAEGVREALQYLTSKGITVSIVSEAATIEATQSLFMFLKTHDLVELFSYVITPLGKFDSKAQLVSSDYNGATKRSGAIFSKLSLDLDRQGVPRHNAVMVGDDPKKDITGAKKEGLKTIQYVGIVDRGRSEADYVLKNWHELKYLI